MNLSINSVGKINLFSLLIAYLSLAERDGGFLIISTLEGLIILFLYLSNKEILISFFSGKYLDGLDRLDEKLLKKYFTILSSIEWKLIINIFPPGFKIFVALIIPSISSVISLLTNILNAWKVFVLGFIFFV